MYSPTHAALGATLALMAPDPFTAFAAGVISHYVLDSLPHGDHALGVWMRQSHVFQRIAGVEVIDLGLAALVTWSFVAHRPDAAISIFAGVFGAILPDLTWGARFVIERLSSRRTWFTRLLDLHQRWHESIHVKNDRDTSFAGGLVWQAVIIAALVLTNR